jgi:hypothetical protein
VVDNRPGAGGNVGTEYTSKQAPDGYTIALISPALAISPSLYKKLGYDPVKDFAPVSLVAQIPNVLLIHPSVPAKTLKDFVLAIQVLFCTCLFKSRDASIIRLNTSTYIKFFICSCFFAIVSGQFPCKIFDVFIGIFICVFIDIFIDILYYFIKILFYKNIILLK